MWTISTWATHYSHLSYLRVPPEQDTGLSPSHTTQQPINAPHLAETQIAFFHCLPVRHMSFSETIWRRVCLQRHTRMRKFQGLPTQACAHVCCGDMKTCWFQGCSEAPQLVSEVTSRFIWSHDRQSFSLCLPISGCFSSSWTAAAFLFIKTDPLL